MATSSPGRRGIVGFSFFSVVILAVLVGLGMWQLERKAEKRTLIAALDTRLAAAPVALPPPDQWASLTPGRDEFTRVTFRAARAGGPDAAVFTSGSALRPDVTGIGTWNFAPVHVAAGGENVVVNFGFVPDGKSPAPATESAPQQLTGYLRFPEVPGWFTPAADVARRVWYARDPHAMAQALHWGAVAPFYIDLEGPAGSGPWPKPGPLEVHLRDQHLQYAITWFGLAAVTLAAYVVWLAGQLRRPRS